MKKIWIILCAVCFVMVGCNIEEPDMKGETVFCPNESTLTEDVFSEQKETEELSETVPQAKETIGGQENSSPIGGHVPCVHSVLYRDYELGFSYHSIGGAFIQYVGINAFDEWTVAAGQEKRAAYERGEASCPYITIVEFVEYFDIPRDVFEILMLDSLYYDDYNVDVIYQGAEASEKYYIRERLQEALAREILLNMKITLGVYVETNHAEERAMWIEKKKADDWYMTEKLAICLSKTTEDLSSYVPFVGRLNQYSIPELVSVFNIPREVVEEAYAKSVAPDFKGMFDIDALYSSTKASTDYKTMNPLDIDMQYIIYPENSEK